MPRKPRKQSPIPGEDTEFTPWDVLRWLGSGVTEEEIIQKYPELKHQDFLDVYTWAAAIGSTTEMMQEVKRVHDRISEKFEELRHEKFNDRSRKREYKVN